MRAHDWLSLASGVVILFFKEFCEMKESLIIAHKEDFIIIPKDMQRHVPSPVGTEKLTNLPCLLYLMNNRMLNIQMSD